MVIQTTTCLPGDICFVLLKPVSEFFLVHLVTSDCFPRCGDGIGHKSYLGGESTNVHNDKRFSKRISGAVAYASTPFLWASILESICLDGLREISRIEGVSGLYRGTMLALFGVSNGAIQFMAYEEMKRWGFGRKRRQYALSGKPWTPEADRLVSFKDGR